MSTAIFRNWKHPKRLNLHGTKITDATLEILEGVPSLNGSISDGPDYRHGLDHLRLSTPRLASDGRNKLRHCAVSHPQLQLEYLDIGGTQRTDSACVNATQRGVRPHR
jgi:hypothetical protein